MEVDPSNAVVRRGAVVIGVDGSGRTHRLKQLAGPDAVWVPRFGRGPDLEDPVGTAVDERRPLVVDDAHLRRPEQLARLAQAAEEGATVLLARRPTVRLPELAALDGIVASTGTVEMLGPLRDETISALLRDTSTEPFDADVQALAVAASAGSPAIAAALVGWSGDDASLPPPLTALVQRRVALLSPAAAALVPVLAEHVPLDPPALERLIGVAAVELADAVDELVEAGLFVPHRDALAPAAAAAVRAAATPAARRARGAVLAAAAVGVAPAGTLDVAVRLRELGVRDAPVGALYLAVARQLAAVDPRGARSWAQDALALLPEDGANRDDAALIDAEAAIVLGEAPGPWPAGGRRSDRWALVRGLRAAQDGLAKVAQLAIGNRTGAGRELSIEVRDETGRRVFRASLWFEAKPLN